MCESLLQGQGESKAVMPSGHRVRAAWMFLVISLGAWGITGQTTAIASSSWGGGTANAPADITDQTLDFHQVGHAKGMKSAGVILAGRAKGNRFLDDPRKMRSVHPNSQEPARTPPVGTGLLPRQPSLPPAEGVSSTVALLPAAAGMPEMGGAHQKPSQPARDEVRVPYGYGMRAMTSAPQALLIDLKSGKVLLEKNAHVRTAPSSMTKILLAYMILEELRDGTISWDDQALISPHASRREGTRMWLASGQTVAYRDLLKGIIVNSGNDACTVAAEGLAGSEEAFAQRMTERARALGALDTHFVNASGLPDAQHWTTCWDLARMAQALLRDFPQEYKTFFSIQKYGYRNAPQWTKNTLLRQGFADGIKTGFTSTGGYGMVASTQRGDRRLLLIINGLTSELAREQEAKRLIQWGFHMFESLVLFQKGREVAQLKMASGETIPLVAEQTIAWVLPRTLMRKGEVTIHAQADESSLISKGQALGGVFLSMPADDQPRRIGTLVAGRAYDGQGWWGRLWRTVAGALASQPSPNAGRSGAVPKPELSHTVP